MVVGNLGTEGEKEDAVAWIIDQMRSLKIEAPDDSKIFYKGDTFKGLLFCKFRNPELAQEAIQRLGKSKLEFQINGRMLKPWFKADAPIAERAPLQFLLGLRWQLGEWGENKKTMTIEDDEGKMKYLGNTVVQASVVEDKLRVNWVDPGWASWGALVESAEIKALIDKIDKRLKDSKDAQPKGKGKGSK